MTSCDCKQARASLYRSSNPSSPCRAIANSMTALTHRRKVRSDLRIHCLCVLGLSFITEGLNKASMEDAVDCVRV
jgi:hypothetical protein